MNTFDNNFYNNNIILESNNIDLYQILNLKSNASHEDIKKSFRKLILKYHPDKNNKISKDYFIKIKYAYDILSNKELKKEYDRKRNLIETNYLFFFYNFLKNFLYSNNINKLLKLMIKKGINCDLSIFNNINNLNDFNDLIKNILDINITVNFTIKEIWLNIPKKIKFKRETNYEFEEIIFPIDFVQIYEKEGEMIKINEIVYNGDLIVNINMYDNTFNGETYFIYDEDLYIIINKDRIYNNKFIINFIDGNKYKFNINRLKSLNNKLGKVFMKKNFGLLKYKSENNIIDSLIDTTHGNLFFILLI